MKYNCNTEQTESSLNEIFSYTLVTNNLITLFYHIILYVCMNVISGSKILYVLVCIILLLF